MTIDEAIATQEDLLSDKQTGVPDKLREAMELGIEALKVIKDAKIVGHYGRLYPLLGETKD